MSTRAMEGKPKIVTVHVRLQIAVAGDPSEALTVVDALLDNGVPADQINDHENEECASMQVRSTLATLGAVADDDGWICVDCDVINGADADECRGCGHDRHVRAGGDS